jgi:hypothetical protein
MSKLRRGTYVRERDGATLLYYNELTSWNFPTIALHDFLRGGRVSSVDVWSVVTDEEEIAALKEHLGSHLKGRRVHHRD